MEEINRNRRFASDVSGDVGSLRSVVELSFDFSRECLPLFDLQPQPLATASE
jgi:hypothetical protein